MINLTTSQFYSCLRNLFNAFWHTLSNTYLKSISAHFSIYVSILFNQKLTIKIPKVLAPSTILFILNASKKQFTPLLFQYLKKLTQSIKNNATLSTSDTRQFKLNRTQLPMAPSYFYQ
jgi:hypothetical protein